MAVESVKISLPIIDYGNLFYRKLSTKHENALLEEKFKKFCF
jgi:hypothetical protein